MTNRIKVLKVAAVAAAAAVALAGCGGGGGGASTSDGKKVMNAMFIGGTADKALIDVVREVTDEFNEKNEFNVEMRIETYENEQYKTKLASLMASNSQPDVFFTWSSGYLRPFVAGKKVLDLTPFLEADAEWKGRFNDGVFGPVTFDDKIYAVPHGAAVAVMYYNTKIFADQGLEAPTTYAEFVDVVTKLKAAGITPLSAPVKDAWIAGQLLQQIGNADAGIALFDETVALTAKWNDPRYVAAGEKLKDLQGLGAFPDGYLGMTNDEGRDLFASGKAAMYYMGSWDMSALTGDGVAIKDDIDVFNIPPANPGENVAVGDVDLAYAVGANTKNADAAAAYIKLFSDTTAQEGFAYDASYLISTNTELDEAKLSPLFIKINALQHDLSGVTPWFDRVFGAGEGVEFNNAAQAIIAGQDPAPRLDELQTFAEANAER